MWTSKGESIVWNMKTEEHDSNCLRVLSILNNYINTTEWATRYENLFRRWLHEDVNNIYNIHDEINMEMIQANIQFNKIEKFNLFYWFDIDRSKKLIYEWLYSPLSKDRLMNVGAFFHPNNALISLTDFIVLPNSIHDGFS